MFFFLISNNGQLKLAKLFNFFICSAISEEEAGRFKDNLRDLDKHLGPYPYDTWKLWKELTSKINDDLIERCQPLCG